MQKYLRWNRWWQEGFTFLFCLLVSVGVLWYVFPQVRQAEAAVTSDGMLYFGDTTVTGTPRVQTYTNGTNTFGTVTSLDASEASNILHVVAKAAPTRSEIMMGHLNVNGRLWVTQCVASTGCDAAADFTPQWNNPGTTATQDCDTAPTASTCERAFDIGYEALSGRAFVAYADNVADTFYYARWDGSAWSPNATPGTPGVSNAVSLPGSAGTPEWIRVIPTGDNLADDRSNRVMVLIADTNADLHAFYWDGTSFDSGTTLFSTLGLCERAQCFDGNWQGTNTFVVSYTNSGVSEIRYQTYVVGTGWSGDAQAYATASAAMWITSVADPTSSRIYVGNASQGDDARGAVWRGDDATDGWTVCAGGNGECPDTAIEIVAGNQSFPAFERFNGELLHVWQDAGTTASSSYWTYTPSATWAATASLGITTTDDGQNVKAVMAPNSDDVMVFVEDVDCHLFARRWDGGAFGTAVTLSINLSNTNELEATCDNAAGPVELRGIGYAYDFVWKLYSPWQRNWRFFSGSDTAATPTTGLALQNVTPTDFATSGSTFRLRINYAERANSAVNGGNARRKLQYTSGCNPNTTLETSCTWTDVDNPGGAGIWRYVTPGPSGATDGTLLGGVTLTGSSATCTAGNGCGAFVLHNSNAAVANMAHNANIIQESEWDVQSNGAAGSTTYYFRIYDTLVGTDGQDTPIYREQDANDCGSGGADACSYPSITTAAPSGPTTDDIMRHGNWWSAGLEQSFFWAD